MNKTLLPKHHNSVFKASDIAFAERLELIDALLLNINPNSCPITLLPHLANELDVDINGLDEKTSRQLVSSALEVHKFKGTAYSLKKAIASENEDIETKEWFNYGGEPYHFKLCLHEIGISQAHFTRLKEMALTYKNVRSVFEGLEIELQPKATQITTTSATAFKLEFKSERQIGLIENKRVLARAVLTL